MRGAHSTSASVAAVRWVSWAVTATAQAAEQVVDDRVDEDIVEGLVGKEQAVVARAPQLVHDRLGVQISPESTLGLSQPETLYRKSSAGPE